MVGVTGLLEVFAFFSVVPFVQPVMRRLMHMWAFMQLWVKWTHCIILRFVVVKYFFLFVVGDVFVLVLPVNKLTNVTRRIRTVP